MDTWKMIGVLAGLALIFFVVTVVSATNDYNDYREGAIVFEVDRLVGLDELQKISIELSDEKVIFYEATSDQLEINYTRACSSERLLSQYESSFDIDESDGIIKITMDNINRNWFYDNWLSRLVTGIYNNQGVLMVGIPATYNDDVSVTVSSGSIEGVDLILGNFSAISSSGSLDFEDVTSDEFYGKSSSGSVRLKNMTITEASSVITSSGRITIETMTANSVELSASSGSINLLDIKGTEYIIANGSSGRITIDGMDTTELEIRNSSGSISANGIKATKTSMTTSSGRIEAKGSFGHVSAESGSGSIDLKCITATDTIKGKASSGRVIVYIPKETQFQAFVNISSGSFNSDFDLFEKRDYQGYDFYKATDAFEDGIDIYITTGSGSSAIYEIY